MPTDTKIVDFDRIKVIDGLTRIDPSKLTLKDRGPHGGRMFDSPAGRVEVYGEILKRYLRLGGIRSVLGAPIAEESGTPDGVGRYSHFEHGSIYWTPGTGAREVHGAIHGAWRELGWERSFLGFPTSDEVDFVDGGRVSAFQGGWIHWWPDTGAIATAGVVVSYVGLECEAETDWDQMSGSDEPYAVIGVVTPDGPSAHVTAVEGGVDDRTARPRLLDVYHGRPAGIVLGTRMMEHDEGDPNRHLGVVEAGVTGVFFAVEKLVGIIPFVGGVLSDVVGVGLDKVAGDVSTAVNRALDLGDDLIGSSVNTLSAKEMLVLAYRTPLRASRRGVMHHVATSRMTGEGADYAAFYAVRPV